MSWHSTHKGYEFASKKINEAGKMVGGWRRFRRKMIIREDLLAEGKLDPDRFVRSASSMVGHIGHANTRNLRASFFERPGANEVLTG